jgi:hypothetical protein
MIRQGAQFHLPEKDAEELVAQARAEAYCQACGLPTRLRMADVLAAMPRCQCKRCDRRVAYRLKDGYALRGLSCRVGGALAEALRDARARGWAEPMLAQITRRNEARRGTAGVGQAEA